MSREEKDYEIAKAHTKSFINLEDYINIRIMQEKNKKDIVPVKRKSKKVLNMKKEFKS